jgi:hypothetical protein
MTNNVLIVHDIDALRRAIVADALLGCAENAVAWPTPAPASGFDVLASDEPTEVGDAAAKPLPAESEATCEHGDRLQRPR